MNGSKLKVLLLSVLLSSSLIVSGCSQPASANISEDDIQDTSEIQSESQDTQNTVNIQNLSYEDEIDYGSDTSWKLNTGRILLGNKISVSGKGITVDGNVIRITSGGDFEVTGTLADGMIYVDTKEKVKLRLSGASITNSDGAAIYFENSQKSFITISSGTENYLCDGKEYTEMPEAKGTLFTNDSLEIKGSGTLYVTSHSKHAIASDDDIVIEEGSIIIESSGKDGLHANDDIKITGGDITINCEKDAVESEGTLTISGGNITINAGDDGIHSAKDMLINGGTIDIRDSHEGLDSKTKMLISGGIIKIRAADDAINTETELTITDGYIYAVCDGDGFDSNGDMFISGGTTVVFSGNNANGPIDIGDRGNKFAVTGGTLIAGGGNMAVDVDSSSTQHCIWINSNFASDEIINIASESGEEIFTFITPKGESLIVVSSNKINADTVYNISTGGSSTGKLSDSLYSGGQYTQGTLLGNVTTSQISVTYGQSQNEFNNNGFGGRRR